MNRNDAASGGGRAGELRGRLVSELIGKGVLRSPEWVDAFMAVPRHVFVPEFHRRLPSGWPGPLVQGEDPGQHEQWLEAVYEDDSLVTRHDGRQPPRPIVSSSAPCLMAVMLEALDVADGMEVLEIGTGTGYNAALLCQRLGSDRVTTIDISRDLVEQAALHLGELGLAPHVVVADGAFGYPPRAPYDRILATCGIIRIPTAWLEQARPGAVLVANMGSVLARLTVGQDGSANGRFLPETASFMSMRSPTGIEQMPFREAVALSQAEGEDVRKARVPEVIDDDTVTVLMDLAMPGVMRFGQNRPEGFSHCLVDPVSRSWARADMDRDPAVIHQAGRRRLWNEAEQLCYLWLDAGQPRHDELRLAVDPDGTHHIWTGRQELRLMVLPLVPSSLAT